MTRGLPRRLPLAQTAILMVSQAQLPQPRLEAPCVRIAIAVTLVEPTDRDEIVSFALPPPS